MALTVGMVGLTHPHSRPHLQTLHALDEVERVLVWDDDTAAREACLGQWPKAVAAADLDVLLDGGEAAAVVVALPNREAPAVLLRAAQAGKPVLAEKPCARTAAEFLPVLREIEASGSAFTSFYLWRRHPAMLAIRDLVQSGALGRLTSVELRMVTTQVGMRDPSHWLFRRGIAGGGILSWLGCHWLDLLRHLTGEEVDSVAALTGTVSGEAIDVEDVASVGMRLSGGAVASLYAGYLLAGGRAGYIAPGYDQAIILRGTEGAVSHRAEGSTHVVTLESHASAYAASPRQEYRFTLPDCPAYGGVYGLEFVRDFLAGREVPVSAVDVLRVLEILDAAYASAAEGRVVAVPNDSVSQDR